MDQSLEARLTEKVHWAWNDGCPVAGSRPEGWMQIASFTRRRWFSYERRRSRKVEDNKANRVEDLARGLCKQFSQGGLRLAGPLISDYRWLAEQLADVILADSQ